MATEIEDVIINESPSHGTPVDADLVIGTKTAAAEGSKFGKWTWSAVASYILKKISSLGDVGNYNSAQYFLIQDQLGEAKRVSYGTLVTTIFEQRPILLPETVGNFGSASGSVTLDFSLGRIINIALNGNISSLVHDKAEPGKYYLIFTQTGANTLTLGSGWKYPNGLSYSPSGNGRVDIWECLFDGTHMHILTVSKIMTAS